MTEPAEDFAEQVGVDPTPQEVDDYLELAEHSPDEWQAGPEDGPGDVPPAPDDEPSDPTGGGSGGQL